MGWLILVNIFSAFPDHWQVQPEQFARELISFTADCSC